MRTTWLMTSGLLLLACGDDAPATRDSASADDVADTSTEPETTVADTLLDSEPETFVDIEPDTLTDVEDAPDVSEPVECDEDAACNMPLDDEGKCHGTCFAIPAEATCIGEVIHGVCRRAVPIFPETVEVDAGDFRLVPVVWPEETTVGEASALEVHVVNETDATLVLPFHMKDPGTFTFANASWAGLTEITLAPGATFALTAELFAQRATVMHGAGIVVTLNVDGFTMEPWSLVHFAPTEPIACGGEHFPATWCHDPDDCYGTSSFYTSAICCDAAFYPSGQCCSDVDCVGGGTCIDQKCVRDVPALTSANSLALGNQRILMVIAEEFPDIAFDPCADRVEQLRETYQLDLVDGWFHELAERRFGARTMATKWEIRVGMTAADVLQEGDGNDFATLQARLDTYMQDRGCSGILGTYDKLIIASSTVDLFGFGGVYDNDGEIMVLNANLPYLLAHELAHSFGTTDLYADLGGQLRYFFSLMGNNVGGQPYPEDQVAWGELGFADFDRNGVIDIAEFAAFPEELVIRDATATLTTKDTLEVKWRFGGVEGERVGHVVLDWFDITVGATSAHVFAPGRTKTAVLDGNQVDLAALRAAGHVEVTLRASLRTTGRDWMPRVLTVDETLDIDITIAE